MNPITTITTTELRTKSSSLIQALLAGYSIELTHRSQSVGTISPAIGKPAKAFDGQAFLTATKDLPPTPKTTDKQREKRYREFVESRYGNHLS